MKPRRPGACALLLGLLASLFLPASASAIPAPGPKTRVMAAAAEITLSRRGPRSGKPELQQDFEAWVYEVASGGLVLVQNPEKPTGGTPGSLTGPHVIGYTPFGEQILGPGLPFTFQGLVAEGQGDATPSQARLLGASYRDASVGLGRWTQRDPVGHAGGINLYRWVNNNPFRYIDPEGFTGFDYVADAARQAQQFVQAMWGADAATPDPTDTLPQKHLGYGSAVAVLWFASRVFDNGDQTAIGDPPSDLPKVDPPTGAVPSIDPCKAPVNLPGVGGPSQQSPGTGSFHDFLITPRHAGKGRSRDKADLPGDAKISTDEVDTFNRLERNHGISPDVASDRLHTIKRKGGFPPNADMQFDRTGGVYHPITGEFLGTLTQPQ